MYCVERSDGSDNSTAEVAVKSVEAAAMDVLVEVEVPVDPEGAASLFDAPQAVMNAIRITAPAAFTVCMLPLYHRIVVWIHRIIPPKLTAIIVRNETMRCPGSSDMTHNG